MRATDVEPTLVRRGASLLVRRRGTSVAGGASHSSTSGTSPIGWVLDSVRLLTTPARVPVRRCWGISPGGASQFMSAGLDGLPARGSTRELLRDGGGGGSSSVRSSGTTAGIADIDSSLRGSGLDRKSTRLNSSHLVI